MTPPDPKLHPIPQPAAEPAAGPAPARGGRKRRVLTAVGALAALAIVALGVHAFVTRGDVATDDAFVEADVVAVAPRVGGTIAEVLIEENAPVKRGQPILRIDDADHQARARQAQAELETARARAGANRAQYAAALANADLAHARVKSADAALELARLQVSYTVVSAAADGVVSRLGARAGQIVQPGQVLGQVVPSRTYLVANFKETQTGTIRPGQKADVEIDAYDGRKLAGHVESLSGGTGARFALLPPDNASGNFVKVVERVPVRIAWDGLPADLPLRAGLSASVTVHTR